MSLQGLSSRVRLLPNELLSLSLSVIYYYSSFFALSSLCCIPWCGGTFVSMKVWKSGLLGIYQNTSITGELNKIVKISNVTYIKGIHS